MKIFNHKRVLLLLFAVMAIGCQKIMAQEKLKLISYNILDGMKMDSTKGKQVFADWIKSYDPDIMALEECNKFTQASLEELAHSYGHPYAINNKETGYPVGITSKYPIVDVRKVTDNMTHGFIVCKIRDLNVIVLHLNPHKYLKRREEIQTILGYIAASPEKKKWMIMGDFNSISPLDKERYTSNKLLARLIEAQQKNPILDNLADRKELDYEVQQRILDFGLKDTYYEKDAAKEYKGTRIDYIYVSKDMLPEVTNVHFIFDDFTAHHSDHHPVIMEFNHKN
jgi:exodeoxyribonuclease-3